MQTGEVAKQDSRKCRVQSKRRRLGMTCLEPDLKARTKDDDWRHGPESLSRSLFICVIHSIFVVTVDCPYRLHTASFILFACGTIARVFTLGLDDQIFHDKPSSVYRSKKHMYIRRQSSLVLLHNVHPTDSFRTTSELYCIKCLFPSNLAFPYDDTRLLPHALNVICLECHHMPLI